MKQNVNRYDFERAFSDMGRGTNFTYEGRNALFDYLEQYEEDCGEEIELDVIALCCEYSEHDTALEAAKEYGYEPELLEYYTDSMESLEMTIEQARSASHQGKCDDDVEELIDNPSIKKQLDSIGTDEIRDDLKEMGAWNDEELANDAENRLRFVWIAAGQITEDYDEDEAQEKAVEWLSGNTQVIRVGQYGVIVAGF